MKHALLVTAIALTAAGYVSASHAASATVPACPTNAPQSISPGVASRHFVREGASAMRLCRYGANDFGTPQGLVQQHLIHGVTIERITHAFNGLKKPPRGIFCMRDDGSEVLVVFAYPKTPPERVAVRLSGCRFAMNGRATRSTTSQLQHRLLNLVKGR